MAKVDDTKPDEDDMVPDMEYIVEFDRMPEEVPKVDDRDPEVDDIVELDGIAEDEAMAT